MQFTATLVADGSSDRILLFILEWLLSQYIPHGTTFEIHVPEWGNLPPNIPRRTLAEKLAVANAFYSASVYFIHRDTEKDGTWDSRSQEIIQAVEAVFKSQLPTYVCVIPVQMTETWLLHNETAIRKAAENPSGREPLQLPRLTRLETEKGAKMKLLSILRTASGLSGFRLRKFEARERARLHRLAALQQEDGFAILRVLPAFQRLESEIAAFADTLRISTNLI